MKSEFLDQDELTEFLLSYYIELSSSVEKTGIGSAVASGGIGLTGWLSDNYQWLASIGVIVGIILGVAGYVTNFYFNWKRTKILEEKNKKES